MFLSLPKRFDSALNKAFRVFVLLILLTGVILRVIAFLQNRNLIIDEANIVRNLSERSFAGLARPLSYEQYAPPVFLWIEKLATLLAGYGEKTVRLYPLLCGIAALGVFYRVLRYFMNDTAAWFPVGLTAFPYLFMRYSVELKQYMPDVLITLLLIWLALATNILQTARPRFVLRWLLAGSLAIWLSMPSVFVLGGIGCYYGLQCLRARNGKAFTGIVLPAIAWVVQFGLYYFLVLRAQANSQYLWDYHHEYFLFAWPDNAREWAYDKARILELLYNAGGPWLSALVVSSGLLLLGVTSLLRQKKADRLLLIGAPILFTLFAAAVKQFSLLDRVSLFMLPLWILLIGVGFSSLMKLRFLPLQLLLVAYGIFVFSNYNTFWLFQQKFTVFEITKGLDKLQEEHVQSRNLYVHDASMPTYKYYTLLHPAKEQYAAMRGAHELSWQTDYAQLAGTIQDTSYFLFTGGFPEEERQKRAAALETSLVKTAEWELGDCRIWVWAPRQD